MQIPVGEGANGAAQQERQDDERHREPIKDKLQRELEVRHLYPVPDLDWHAAIANEQFERLSAGQSPREQRVLELRAEETTFAEIARRLNVSERTARRIVERSMRRWDGPQGR